MIREIGAFAGLAAFFGLAVLAMLSFTQGRDLRRLREWAGSAPERDAERKESTSAAAAQRAEELRQLDEARAEERKEAELREERRRRREAGLPELTRSERLQQRFSGGKLREPLYLAGLFVLALVVAGGIAYAVLEGFGGEPAKQRQRPASAALRPSDIDVAVFNGTAVSGLAGLFGDRIERKGFNLGVVTNSSSSFEESIVMFRQGRGREAHRVATALKISRVRPMTSEIAPLSAGAPVAVVIGEDNASSTG